MLAADLIDDTAGEGTCDTFLSIYESATDSYTAWIRWSSGTPMGGAELTADRQMPSSVSMADEVYDFNRYTWFFTHSSYRPEYLCDHDDRQSHAMTSVIYISGESGRIDVYRLFGFITDPDREWNREIMGCLRPVSPSKHLVAKVGERMVPLLSILPVGTMTDIRYFTDDETESQTR